jgi:membrane-bound lytic murein transglycosylase D
MSLTRNFTAAVLIFFCVSCAQTKPAITAAPGAAHETGKPAVSEKAPAAANAAAAANPAAEMQGQEVKVVAAPANPANGTKEKNGNTEIKPSEAAKNGNSKIDQNGNDTAASQDQESLDQALELFAQSKIFWAKGDMDNALKCLDDAYSFILDVNGDPDISRQKDDLRLMISKRILEICATRHVVTAGKMSEIPMILNDDVQREIRSFQTIERNFFIRSYQRSAAYRPAIVKFLKEAGLPQELSWLPLVESGFSVTALSRARALGLWQFIPSTGYKYALQRDRWVDERMDVDKSTKAAIAYLKELHGIFGDWLTCLAAYNCGEGRVIRVISKQHINYMDHFWDLYRQLPNETARYVPRFLATLHIIKDPAKYGMDLQALPETQPAACEIVKTSKCMRVQDIADAISVSREALAAMNSELRFQMTPDREYEFKVPAGGAKLLTAELDKIPQWEPPKPPRREYSRRGVHRVRKGESLAGIARKYKVSTQDLIAYNNLTGKIRSGQRLKIPGKAAASSGHATKKKRGKKANTNTASYKVRSGDTLASIARSHGTTVAELKRMNRIKGSSVGADKVIKVPLKKTAEKETAKKEN